MKMKGNSIIALVFCFLLAGLAQADACPVCFDAKEETRWAFYFSTALLSILPLSMVGGVILWIRTRFKRVRPESGARPE